MSRRSSLLLLSLLLSAPAAFAQSPAATGKSIKNSSDAPTLPRDPATGKVTYSAVVEVPGATQDQLYERAKVWLARNSRGPEGVAPIEDKANGQITAQGKLVAPVKASYTALNSSVLYTMLVYVKDGKYKYEFTNFSEESLGAFEQDEPNIKTANGFGVMGLGMMPRVWNRVRNNTDIEVKQWIARLEASMKTNASPSDF